MQKLVFINGAGNQIDLNSIADNFGIVNWQGLSNTDLNIQSQQVPFEDGGVFLDALMEQREIELTVAIYDGNDLELRYQKKRELISALNPKAGEGVLIYTNDYLSKQIKAVPHIPLFENKNSNDAGTLKASIAFTCCDPYWEDVEETEINFSYAEMPIITNKGDVPTQIKIKFETSNVENPAIIKLNDTKSVKYKGNLLKDLYIDTNFGQKQVYTENKINKVVDFAGNINCVCYSPELKIYVGCSEGVIYYSDDSIHWSFSNNNVSIFKDVIWCADFGMFIAVGSNVIRTSLDGINWLSNTTGALAYNFNGICYSHTLQMLVAVADNGYIVTSTNGTEWTLRTSGTNLNLYSVCYSEAKGLFVAVGNQIGAKSSDGINWDVIINISQIMFHIEYINALNLFIAVGYAGWVFRSSDASTWNSTKSSNTYDTNLNSFCYDSNLNLLIAVGDLGTLRTSADAISWTERTSGINRNLKDVIFISGTNLILTVGEHSVIRSSTNATSWVSNYDGTNAGFSSVVFSKHNNLFVGAGNGIVTSKDGENWVRKTIQNFYPSSVVYAEDLGLFVAVGNDSNNGCIYSSKDGSIWVLRFTGGRYLKAICYSKKLHKFVAMGNSGGVATSSDGISWGGFTIVSKTFNGITYAEDLGLFVAVGDNGSYGCIYSSEDGENWTDRTSGNIVKQFAVTYSEELGLFISVGSGYLYKSVDGISWTGTNVTYFYYGIIYCKERKLFYMVGASGRIVTSPDGTNWNSETSGVMSRLNCIVYSEEQNRFVVGGVGVNLLIYYTKENQIQNMDEITDMNLNLSIGDNQFRLAKDAGNFSASIRFRQKYIGV